jgi:uncharacterized NAD(P)/FAD-binding protein YdhS
MVSVAVIGLGSRGLGVLERIVTLASLTGPGIGQVDVHLVDPLCDGAGVHDVTQPDYLLLNTTASQVSLFPDACTVGEAVPAPGPSLFDWVTERGLRVAGDGFTVGTTGRPVRETDFLPRRVLGEYLGWFLEQLRSRAPRHVRLHTHVTEAVDLTDGAGDTRLVTLADGGTVQVDHVFLTTGYTANEALPAGSGGLIGRPYPLPACLADVEPGHSVAIAGFGLSAMDMMSSLTVGRGGRFEPDGPAGELRYLPSGDEPTIYFYSRTGVPCRARPRVVEFGPTYHPLAVTPANVDTLRASLGGGPLDFEVDVLPLVFTEMRVGYRRCEARLTSPAAADAMEAELTAAAARGPAALVALLDELDGRLGPFDAVSTFDGAGDMLTDDTHAYQKWLADVLRRDLADGVLGFTGSTTKAALDVIRVLRDAFRYVVDYRGITTDSLDEFTRRTVPAVNRAVVGPQWERHAELLALMAAGVAHVPFGPAPVVVWDADAGGWTITSTRLTEPFGRRVDWVASAYLDLPAVDRSASPLLASLHARGRIRPFGRNSRLVPGIDLDSDHHPLDADGNPDRRVWALGPLCEGVTFYNNLVPSPDMWSRPVYDAHRCVAAMFTGHLGTVDSSADGPADGGIVDAARRLRRLANAPLGPSRHPAARPVPVVPEA